MTAKTAVKKACVSCVHFKQVTFGGWDDGDGHCWWLRAVKLPEAYRAKYSADGLPTNKEDGRLCPEWEGKRRRPKKAQGPA